jgi:hypothetical protein
MPLVLSCELNLRKGCRRTRQPLPWKIYELTTVPALWAFSSTVCLSYLPPCVRASCFAFSSWLISSLAYSFPPFPT